MSITLKSNPDGVSGAIQVNGNNVATAHNNGVLDVPKGVGGTPTFLAYFGSGTSTPNSIYTKMIATNEVLDTHSSYDPTTGNFTAPVAGYYTFYWTIDFSAADGMLFSRLMKNTSTTLALGSSCPLATVGTTSSGSFTALLAVNDVINFQAFQGSGGTLTSGVMGHFQGALTRAV